MYIKDTKLFAIIRYEGTDDGSTINFKQFFQEPHGTVSTIERHVIAFNKLNILLGDLREKNPSQENKSTSVNSVRRFIHCNVYK